MVNYKKKKYLRINQLTTKLTTDFENNNLTFYVTHHGLIIGTVCSELFSFLEIVELEHLQPVSSPVPFVHLQVYTHRLWPSGRIPHT